MRFATWNVNSIRARVDRVASWLERSQVDVLAMQEIKCKPEQFPLAPFEALGYEVAAHGLNQWNGVAIASRVGLSEVQTEFAGQPGFAKTGDPALEARAIGALCGDTRVWSVYVPNGRALADPHYAYKLSFLAELRQAAFAWADAPAIIAGDFNVAPLTTDIWSETDASAETHVTPESREAFHALESAGYEELSRRFIPEPNTYTFWDYQQLRFPRGEGMRIDFVYASAVAAARATGVVIDREERKGQGASDHVPVIVDFDEP
ncbi:exodeoxyribonuclease III [Demequina sp.]|uniref:exodeoxyribonuclease III n=1 Tax=Demequina sp. TaxID=2050685 RepID=UPI003D0C89D8